MVFTKEDAQLLLDAYEPEADFCNEMDDWLDAIIKAQDIFE